MKKMLYNILLVFVLFGTLNLKTQAIIDEPDLYKPVEVKDGSILDIVECVSLAYQNSPKIRHKLYELNIAKSRVGMAKSRYFPIFSIGAGFYNENNSNHIYYDKHYRDLPSVGAAINQLVWDFGRTTAFIKMEKFYQVAAEYEFMDSLCATLFDIKAKYYTLLKAKAMMDLAQNNVDMLEDIVKSTKKDKEADLLTSEVYLSEGKVALIKAQNEYYNARVDLSNAMYLDNETNYTIKLTETFNYDNGYKYGSNIAKINSYKPQELPFKKDEALNIAYRNNPDLMALNATKDAMDEALKFVNRVYMPELKGSVGYRLNNTNFATNNSLQVGLELEDTVNFMEAHYDSKRAENEVNIANNEIKLFKKNIQFELLRAFNNIQKAQSQIPEAQKGVEISIKNYTIVEDLYKKDKIDYTSLHDAREDYIRALDNYIMGLYDYNMALIQLEMAMHYHLTDIHHKAEHAMSYHPKELEEHLNKVLECDRKEAKKKK